MSHRLISKLLALVLGVASCGALPPFSFAQGTERCTLRGTVANSATSAPVAHALVLFQGPATGYRFTDVSGTFQVDNLPQGSYLLQVSKPGFVSEQDPMQKAPLGADRFGFASDQEPAETPQQPSFSTNQVELTPTAPALAVKLVPMVSLEGTVVDQNHEPVEGVSVQAVEAEASLTGVDYRIQRTATTDDRGSFRFINLKPGDYLVRLAGEAASTHYFSGVLNPANDHRGMRPIYYPNADSTESAMVLHLKPGEHATADFQNSTEVAFDLNGQLAGFVPRAWTRIRLYREGDRLPVARAFVNLTTGRFRVTDLPNGSYTFRVVQWVEDGQKWLAAEAPVVVSSQPVSNLEVELSAGSDIPVSISYEASAHQGEMLMLALLPQHSPENIRRAQLGAPQSRHLAAIPGQPEPAQDGNQAEPSGNGGVGETGVLANVLPDTYRLTATTFGDDYVESARLGEREILKTLFSLGAGSQGEIRLVVKGDSGSLSGQITVSGKPALGSTVYVIPVSGGQPKFGGGDQTGHYTVTGVPPGEYRVMAWTKPPSTDELRAATGTPITVQPYEQKELSIEATQNGYLGPDGVQQ